MKIHSSLALLVLAASVHAQPAPAEDPHELPSQPPTNVSVCYETFSAPLALAAKLQRDDKSDSELYALLAAAEGKDGIRQESFDMVRCKPSQKATVESITERIYPTEYEPPELPYSIGVAITPPPVKDTPAPVPDAAKLKDALPLENISVPTSPASATAFETRNVGRTLEFETSVNDDPQRPTVHLIITPEFVTQVERRAWGQGLSKTELPGFETQRIDTAVVAAVDHPMLLGTASRPPVSQADPESAQRVWFAFATVTIVKP